MTRKWTHHMQLEPHRKQFSRTENARVESSKKFLVNKKCLGYFHRQSTFSCSAFFSLLTLNHKCIRRAYIGGSKEFLHRSVDRPCVTQKMQNE